ncbi:MAG: hypothetical protein NT085_04710 [candidate division SR1 bacterium]|nr:hypothetical protein [candidate division SR1 bacterium]
MFKEKKWFEISISFHFGISKSMKFTYQITNQCNFFGIILIGSNQRIKKSNNLGVFEYWIKIRVRKLIAFSQVQKFGGNEVDTYRTNSPILWYKFFIFFKELDKGW